MKSLFSWFRTIAFVEGISYLVLLCIAMPLKYFANQPQAVRITGMAHGVLFVAYMLLALMVMSRYKRKFNWLVVAFIVSIIPFGTFWMEKKWRKEEEAFLQAGG